MGIGDIEKVAYAHGTFHSKSCTSGVGACPNAAASLHLGAGGCSPAWPINLSESQPASKDLSFRDQESGNSYEACTLSHYYTGSSLLIIRQVRSVDSVDAVDPEKQQHPSKESYLDCGM
jgi:hypothetical protein